MRHSWSESLFTSTDVHSIFMVFLLRTRHCIRFIGVEVRGRLFISSFIHSTNIWELKRWIRSSLPSKCSHPVGRDGQVTHIDDSRDMKEGQLNQTEESWTPSQKRWTTTGCGPLELSGLLKPHFSVHNPGVWAPCQHTCRHLAMPGFLVITSKCPTAFVERRACTYPVNNASVYHGIIIFMSHSSFARTQIDHILSHKININEF